MITTRAVSLIHSFIRAYSGEVVQLFRSKLSTHSGDVVHPLGAKRRWLLTSWLKWTTSIKKNESWSWDQHHFLSSKCRELSQSLTKFPGETIWIRPWPVQISVLPFLSDAFQSKASRDAGSWRAGTPSNQGRAFVVRFLR